MHFTLFSKAVLALAIVISFTGCKKEDSKFSWSDKKGLFILNEGNFTHGNASISFLDPNNQQATNDLFSKVNNRPLGDIAQSMATFNGKYYIVVNNSGKVEIVNGLNFTSVGVINGLAQPRYFLGIDKNKAYVSQWGANGIDGSLAVVDTLNNIIKTIPTGAGTEKMIKLGDFVYIANSGGYSLDSTIVVINSSTDAVVSKINVGFNPQAIVADKNNMLWVLCGGKWNSDYTGLEKPGALVKINPASNQVELTLPFSSLAVSYDRKSLSINGTKDILYYTLEGKLYEQPVSAISLNTTAKITREFYNVSADPSTGMFYGADGRNGTTNGWIIRYNTSYAKVDSFEVGIQPDEMFFN